MRLECDLCHMSPNLLWESKNAMTLCGPCESWLKDDIETVIKGTRLLMKMYNKSTPKELGKIL